MARGPNRRAKRMSLDKEPHWSVGWWPTAAGKWKMFRGCHQRCRRFFCRALQKAGMQTHSSGQASPRRLEEMCVRWRFLRTFRTYYYYYYYYYYYHYYPMKCSSRYVLHCVHSAASKLSCSKAAFKHHSIGKCYHHCQHTSSSTHWLNCQQLPLTNFVFSADRKFDDELVRVFTDEDERWVWFSVWILHHHKLT